MKRALPVLLALLLGVGLGYLLFRGKGSQSRSAPEGRASAPGRSVGGDSAPGTGDRPSRGRERGENKPTAALLRAARERNARLVSENKRLAHRLDTLEQDLRFARGKAMPWPSQTPARFNRKPVVSAVGRALREAGLSGEVTDVDCREYPCVLSGDLKGQVSQRRFKRILSTRALSAYGKDHAQTSITTRSGHDSLGRPWQRSHFAIALMVAGPPGTELDVRRTVYRLRQLLDAATGQ